MGCLSQSLLHKLSEQSHLSSLMKIAVATNAVSLQWPVLPGQWRSVDFNRNLHCRDTDSFARLSANTVSLFWRSVGFAVQCVPWLRLGRWGLYLKIRSPKLISEHNTPTLNPTCLCLDDIIFFDFRRWLTNIWLCRLRGVFSSKRPKYFGKYAYNIPTHRNLLYHVCFILYTTPYL